VNYLFKKAKKLAEAEMNVKSDVVELTPAEVFVTEFCHRIYP